MGPVQKAAAWIAQNWRTVARPVAARVGAIVAVFLVCWGVIVALDRPISRVDVDGQFQRVSTVELEQAVAPFRGTGLISINLPELRAALETIPWVDRARIERSWPNALHVTITEQVPAARWGDEGLLNVRGELFLKGAERFPPELPRLYGPDGTQGEVAKLYLETYPRLLAVGMRLTKVELDARGAWELTIGKSVQVRLGREHVEERLERFLHDASPLIAARTGQVAYLDMRYSNGFSVGWSTQVARVSNSGEDKTPNG
jgi:cell division protein FtsQ